MRLLLDPDDLWLGRPGRFLNKPVGDRAPIAIDDALTVYRNANPVTVDVLANDIDPDGTPISLVSVYAALGTATAAPGDVVLYTPPANFTGFDTIVYEVSDAGGITSSGQVDVTVIEPVLAIEVTPQNRMEVISDIGTLDLDITADAPFDGSFQVDAGTLSGGPVNLVAPQASGTVAAGATLTAKSGLWLHDTDGGTPVRRWQWQLDGTDITGATGMTHTVAASEAAGPLSVVEYLSQSYGERGAASNALAGSVAAGFDPGDDSNLIAWWDASDAGSLTVTDGKVDDWADLVSGQLLTQTNGIRRPATGTRTMNGLNVLDFDGGDSLTGPVTVPASGDVAIHMALAIDSVASEYAAVLSADATNDFQIEAGSSTQFDGRLNATVAPTTSLSGGPFSGMTVLSVLFDLTGAGTIRVWVGGSLRASAAYATPLDAAQSLKLMTNRSENASVDGAIAEVIATGAVGNHLDYHNYLSAKWGIT